MALAVGDLHKEYPTPLGPLAILHGISLTVEAGQSLAITGASGSGKSTLLQIVGTLDSPTAGKVSLDGIDPFALNERDLARFRAEKVGFVFQDHYLLPQCTALENVLIPTLADSSLDGRIYEAEARKLLESVGLTARADHRPAELSGGERQRVAIARSLIRSPKLLLADEPTGNLDRTNSGIIGELLLKLVRDRQLILLVVTHSRELAKTFARQMEMIDGQLR